VKWHAEDDDLSGIAAVRAGFGQHATADALSPTGFERLLLEPVLDPEGVGRIQREAAHEEEADEDHQKTHGRDPHRDRRLEPEQRPDHGHREEGDWQQLPDQRERLDTSAKEGIVRPRHRLEVSPVRAKRLWALESFPSRYEASLSSRYESSVGDRFGRLGLYCRLRDPEIAEQFVLLERHGPR